MEAFIVLFMAMIGRQAAIWFVSLLVWGFGHFTSIPHLSFMNILFVVYSCWFIKLAITTNLNPFYKVEINKEEK